MGKIFQLKMNKVKTRYSTVFKSEKIDTKCKFKGGRELQEREGERQKEHEKRGERK